jgi:hypothetical protein
VDRRADRARHAGLADRAARATELDQFTLVHGSPRDPTWEYVISLGVARANMAEFETTHCLVGHTHVPLVFRKPTAR